MSLPIKFSSISYSLYLAVGTFSDSQYETRLNYDSLSNFLSSGLQPKLMVSHQVLSMIFGYSYTLTGSQISTFNAGYYKLGKC